MNVASALALASLWALVGTATLEPETEVPDLRVAIRKLTRTAEPRAPESIPTRPGVYRRALKASDGVHIAAYLYVPDELDRTKPLWVLLPDLGTTHLAFDLSRQGYAPALSHNGVEVATLDWRGTGISQTPSPDPSLDDLLLKDLPAICDLTGPDRPIVLVGWGYAGAIAYAAAAEGSPLKQRIVGVVSLGGVVELDAPPNAHLAKLWEGKQPVDLSLAMQRRVPGRTESLFELLWVHGSSLDTQSKQDFRAHGLSVISSNQIAQLRSWAASGKTTLGGRPYPEQLRTLKVPVWELDGMLDAWSHPEAASAVRDYVPRELLEARAATRFVGFAEDPSHLGLVQGKVAEQEILPMLLSFRDKLERLRREGAP